jgi:glycosyltransferase involved in cell wall biosynthesis
VVVKRKKILLTTPDFPPKLGGLSTFTVNIKNTFEILDYEVELFQWNSIKELRVKSKAYAKRSADFAAIVNIHFQGGYFLRSVSCKHINFYHGSEILYYSSNIIKMIMKKLLKSRMNQYIAKSHLNLFIAKFTMSKLQELGLALDYGRDIILSNCVRIDQEVEYSLSNFKNTEIDFVCVARDVPHKNLLGCVEFCEQLATISNRKIKLFISTKENISSTKIKIVSINSISDQKREEIYKSAHFNLLLSLDHSNKGFYEGFGLTVLEAGKYGTPSVVIPSGGLFESVHDSFTGWHIKDTSTKSVLNFWENLENEKYEQIARQCYNHTHESHSLNTYTKFFKKVVEGL